MDGGTVGAMVRDLVHSVGVQSACTCMDLWGGGPKSDGSMWYVREYATSCVWLYLLMGPPQDGSWAYYLLCT